MTRAPHSQSPIQPSRRSAIDSFLAMDMLSQAARLEAAGQSVVHLELGEPSASAPLAVRQAAIKALEAGRLGYTEALGLPALRARIAAHYAETYGVAVAPERVAVTTGSSGGFTLAFLALFDVGARVAIAAPGYPAYRNILQGLGLNVVPIETSAATRHVVTAAALAQAHRDTPLDGVLLMSPGNPTGTMMSFEDIAAVAAFCDSEGIAFISDEIYHGLTYARPAHTVLAASDQVVIVNSFSKYYCMTGWRIGWLVLPEALVRPVERLQQNFAISVPTLSQIAAIAAFEVKPELELIKAGYARNRALLMDRLPSMGLGDIHPMDGAFYAYCDVGRFTNDSVDFCRRLLVDAGVATTPGVDFDPLRGHRTIRLSFAGSTDSVQTALDRLEAWLRR